MLLTSPGGRDDAHRRMLEDAVQREISAAKTSEGLRFDGTGYETQVYWQDGYFQTTIPYWVQLFGCVCEVDRSTGPLLDMLQQERTDAPTTPADAAVHDK